MEQHLKQLLKARARYLSEDFFVHFSSDSHTVPNGSRFLNTQCRLTF